MADRALGGVLKIAELDFRLAQDLPLKAFEFLPSAAQQLAGALLALPNKIAKRAVDLVCIHVRLSLNQWKDADQKPVATGDFIVGRSTDSICSLAHIGGTTQHQR